MKRSLKIMLGAAAIAVLSATAHAAVFMRGTQITASETWTAGNTYVLTNITYVLSGATLTIEPGVVVRGEPESSVGAKDPGTLVICRGAKIIANGTAANPIVFTDLDDPTVFAEGGYGTGVAADYTAPDSNKSSLWGGVVVLGRTYIAVNSLAGPDSARENQIEGLTASGSLGYYGAGGLPNDDDNSGQMSYCSIRFGGTVIGTANEINGLTLGGVGRGTKIHHIEVVQNVDDGFEMFGGTVNLKYLASIRNGDDSFDYDEGFRGKGQFWFALQGETGGASAGSRFSNKGSENDGGLSPDGSQPYSIPTIYNVTYVGMGVNSYGANQAMNSAIVFRDNAGGRYYNSLFLDFGGAAVAIECRASDSPEQRIGTLFSSASSTYHPDNTLGGYELELKNNIFYRADGWPNKSPAVQADWNAAVAEGDSTTQVFPNFATINAAVFDGTQPSWASNNVNTTTLPITSLLRDTSIAAGSVQTVTNIDARPVGAALSTPTPAPADGFFSPVNYKGAFSPTYNWLQGWTWVNASAGLVPSISNPSAPLSTDLTLLSSVSFETVNGVTYVIEASSDMSSWVPIATVTGNGTTMSYVDTRALSTRQFYRVVVQ
jgi:hypothetical protein